MATKKEEKIEYSHILNKSVLELNEGQLEGLPRNPRFIKDEKFAKLKLSLQQSPEFLKARPLLVYPLGNGHFIIVAGNMRFLAGKEVGITDYPCYIFAKDTTVDKLKEYTIKDNIAYGSNDWEALADEWDTDDLEDWGMDIPDFGEDEPEQPAEQKKVEEDDYDPDKDDEVEIFVKEGEIWQCGDHRLLCGDSTNAENVKRLMQGETAQMYLTDPPYNVDYGKTADRKIAGDKMEDKVFEIFLKDVFSNANSVLREGASFYIWFSDNKLMPVREAMATCPWTISQQLIWNKNSLVLGHLDYQKKHEPCLYGWKRGANRKWYNDSKQTSVIDWDRPTKSKVHPMMKPVGLFCYLMQNSSKEGDIVIDTFGGSGTTMIAAEQLGRKARLMELSPKYCSVIITRWQELTGKKAARIDGTEAKED